MALRSLDARLNCLCSLPDGLENLDSLETLNVSQNLQYLRELPYGIGLLVSLRELDVSYNSIDGDSGFFSSAARGHNAGGSNTGTGG
jgi:Leucine-rich repeat (LRR) protein